MPIFSKEAIALRKQRAARALDSVLKDQDVVLIFCGAPIQRPGGLDQTYPFLPHPEYYWLSGSRRAHGILAYAKNEGWTHFVLPVRLQEKLWEGEVEAIEGKDVAEFEAWRLKKNFQRIFALGRAPKKFKKLNSKDHFPSVQENLNRVRRVKDQEEIELIRRAGGAAAKAYALLKNSVRPGVSERELQIAFEAEVFRAGADKLPYDTIVGSGVNSATLHAIPTKKILRAGEIVLVDGGADIEDYCVDITRVFAVDGKFTSQQKDLFDIVLTAQTKAIELCQPGVAWSEVHRVAALHLAGGLKNLNLLKGPVEDSLETGAISTFFPHGIGHMVGHRVRDVGPVFNQPVKEHCGVRLRVDLPLAENFLMTVEPGLYFGPALLEHTRIQGNFKDQINWREVEKWKDIGGIRLEDDILIDPKGPRNLTAEIPK